MKSKFLLCLILLLAIVSINCSSPAELLSPEHSPTKTEDPSPSFRVNVQCVPPNEGNYVHLFAVERIASEGILEACPLDGIPCNEIPCEGWTDDTYFFYPSKMITKIRYIAIPGPGYMFDHWDFSPEDNHKDSFMSTNNSDASLVAHFEPFPY